MGISADRELSAIVKGFQVNYPRAKTPVGFIWVSGVYPGGKVNVKGAELFAVRHSPVLENQGPFSGDTEPVRSGRARIELSQGG